MSREGYSHGFAHMYGLNLFDVLGWGLTLIGLGVTLLGLFARRIVVRSEPRCTKCRYELDPLAFVEQTPCPECGTTPTSQSALYTLGRSKKLILLGVALTIGSFVLSEVPRVRSQGWSSLLPTSIQVRLWQHGDTRLRGRIFGAYKESKLSDTQLDMLRKQVVAELANPTNKPNLSYNVLAYERSYNNKPPLIELDDYAQAMRTAPDKTLQSLIHHLRESNTPPKGDILDVRRDLLDRESKTIQRLCWEWILKHPIDAEDERMIRAAFSSMDDSDFHSHLMYNTDLASPELQQILIRMYRDESVLRRDRVIEAIGYIAFRSNGRIKLDDDMYRITLENIHSKNPSIAHYAYGALDTVPESLLPELESLYLNTTDEKSLARLIHQFRRMEEWSPAFIPTMYKVAMNPEIPFYLRHDALRACEYIAERYRRGEVPSPLPLYVEELQVALEETKLNSEKDKLKLYAKLGSVYEPPRLASMIVLAEQDGIEHSDQFISWIENHPALELLIHVSFEASNPEPYHPETLHDRLHASMTWALDQSDLHQDITIALFRGLDLLESPPASDSSSTSNAPALAD